MKKDNAIEVHHLYKQYRLGKINSNTLQEELLNRKNHVKEEKFEALHDINLEIKKGETFGIIGANGAGKSTLLKILSSITTPSAGCIETRGRISSMLEVGTGFHRDMTGRENIYMNGAILGMSRSQIDEVIEDIIDFSEIGDFIDTPVKRYSSGMYVKLAFSVAIFLNNEIIIMDEILSVGDYSFQNKCIDKIKQIAKSGNKTILLVSHNIHLIHQLASRTMVLEKGKIGFIGDTEEAISYYMNQAIEGKSLSVDLNKIEHSSGDGDVRLIHLDILHKRENTYYNNESLEFQVTFDSKVNIKKGILRFTLRNDSDVGLGSCFVNNVCIEKGVSSKCFSFDLKNIKRGVFYVSLGVLENKKTGNLVHDHITRVFKFEVINKEPWNTSAFGYFDLDLREIKD